jgi:hypothetical protein
MLASQVMQPVKSDVKLVDEVEVSSKLKPGLVFLDEEKVEKPVELPKVEIEVTQQAEEQVQSVDNEPAEQETSTEAQVDNLLAAKGQKQKKKVSNV